MTKSSRTITSCLLCLFAIFSAILREIPAVRIMEMKVPAQVQSGDSVTLTCVFDLEGQTLYSLNWWRNNDQFYQFDPSEGKQQIIYDTHGINVDERASNLREVRLRNVTKATEGDFKCEIVADFPSYERDSAIAPMEIIQVSTNPPNISLARDRYNKIGDHLKANCTTKSFDIPPTIIWYLNGKKVSSKHVRQIYPSKRIKDRHHQHRNGHHHKNHHKEHHKKKRSKRHLSIADHVISHIHFTLRKTDFIPSGKILLTCSAIYGGLFSRSTKVDITKPEYPSMKPSLRVSSVSTFTIVPCQVFLLLFIVLAI